MRTSKGDASGRPPARCLVFDYPPAWSYDVGEEPMVGRTFGQYPGVVITIDGEELGVFDRDVSDFGVPEESLLPGRIGNLHSLRVAPGTARQDPLTVRVTVVVHAPNEP